MTRPWVTVRAWVGSARPGKCRYCRRPVVWVMTDEGARMAFDLGFTVREVVTDPRTGVKFTVLDRDDKHDCRKKPGKTATKDQQKRRW